MKKIAVILLLLLVIGIVSAMAYNQAMKPSIEIVDWIKKQAIIYQNGKKYTLDFSKADMGWTSANGDWSVESTAGGTQVHLKRKGKIVQSFNK